MAIAPRIAVQQAITIAIMAPTAYHGFKLMPSTKPMAPKQIQQPKPMALWMLKSLLPSTTLNQEQSQQPLWLQPKSSSPRKKKIMLKTNPTLKYVALWVYKGKI